MVLTKTAYIVRKRRVESQVLTFVRGYVNGMSSYSSFGWGSSDEEKMDCDTTMSDPVNSVNLRTNGGGRDLSLSSRADE